MYTKEFCGKNKTSFYIYSEKFIFIERVFGAPKMVLLYGITAKTPLFPFGIFILRMCDCIKYGYITLLAAKG